MLPACLEKTKRLNGCSYLFLEVVDFMDLVTDAIGLPRRLLMLPAGLEKTKGSKSVTDLSRVRGVLWQTSSAFLDGRAEQYEGGHNRG